jgi:hypothetical protein
LSDFTCKQCFQAGRRFQTKLASQQTAVTLVLKGCLESVALSEVHLNQRLMRALTQGLSANSSQAGLDSLTVPAGPGKPLACRFEGMKPQVVVPLPVSYNPIVLIPIWQQIR